MSTSPAPRALTLPAATALVVGQVIAVGIFLTPGTIIRTLASPLWVLGLWVVMGGMAICGALVYGGLAARYPQAGGGYVYLREAYGPRVAFAYGWKCLLVMDPGITAALAAGFATYVAYLVPLDPFAVRLVAITPIAAFALLHIAGVRLGASVLSTVAVLKVVLVLGLTVAAFLSPAASSSHFTPFVARATNAPPLAAALAGAFVAAFFSFGGWWEVTKLAGEVARPSWTLPRALVVGLVLVTLCYASATMAFMAVVPREQIAVGDAVVAQVGEAIFGAGGGTTVALIVIVCVLGSLGGMQMVAPRLYVAMAADGLFPKAAAVSHPRFGTPARAIAIQAALASLLVLLGTFDSIVAYFVFVTVAFIAATVAGVFILRRRDPALVVPGHPWTTTTFIGLVLVLMGLLALSQPVQAGLGAVVVAASLPIYAWLRTARPIPDR